MALSVKLNVFEGPLDLLLHLIDKNKIDIYDIPIVEITSRGPIHQVFGYQVFLGVQILLFHIPHDVHCI